MWRRINGPHSRQRGPLGFQRLAWPAWVAWLVVSAGASRLAQPPPVKFAVMQNQQPVGNAPSGGDAFAMKEQNQIRYRVMVQTDQLKPGTFTALAGLPQAVEMGSELICCGINWLGKSLGAALE